MVSEGDHELLFFDLKQQHMNNSHQIIYCPMVNYQNHFINVKRRKQSAFTFIMALFDFNGFSHVFSAVGALHRHIIFRVETFLADQHMPATAEYDISTILIANNAPAFLIDLHIHDLSLSTLFPPLFNTFPPPPDRPHDSAQQRSQKETSNEDKHHELIRHMSVLYFLVVANKVNHVLF